MFPDALDASAIADAAQAVEPRMPGANFAEAARHPSARPTETTASTLYDVRVILPNSSRLHGSTICLAAGEWLAAELGELGGCALDQILRTLHPLRLA
jgi:hypothetical protein